MTNSTANSSANSSVTTEELVKRIEELERKVTELTTPHKKAQKEMTDEHARNILNGSLAKLDHNKAADELGLSYGQIYSCRHEYTFRHIHKELKSLTPPWVNPWKK